MAPRSRGPNDKGLLPPLEWEPAGLGAPGGMQGTRTGLQGPHAPAPGQGPAEQPDACAVPQPSPAAVQSWELSGWEAREKQRPEEGKHPDKQSKRTGDFQTPLAVLRGEGEPGPGAAGGHHPPASARGRGGAAAGSTRGSAPARLSPELLAPQAGQKHVEAA